MHVSSQVGLSQYGCLLLALLKCCCCCYLLSFCHYCYLLQVVSLSLSLLLLPLLQQQQAHAYDCKHLNTAPHFCIAASALTMCSLTCVGLQACSRVCAYLSFELHRVQRKGEGLVQESDSCLKAGLCLYRFKVTPSIIVRV